jgi:hypothetical protein
MDDEREEPRRSQRQLTMRRRRERPLLGVLGWGRGRRAFRRRPGPARRRAAGALPNRPRPGHDRPAGCHGGDERGQRSPVRHHRDGGDANRHLSLRDRGPAASAVSHNRDRQRRARGAHRWCEVLPPGLSTNPRRPFSTARCSSWVSTPRWCSCSPPPWCSFVASPGWARMTSPWRSGPRLCHQPEDDSVGTSRLAERLGHQRARDTPEPRMM